jgi:hypothetical protein
MNVVSSVIMRNIKNNHYLSLKLINHYSHKILPNIINDVVYEYVHWHLLSQNPRLSLNFVKKYHQRLSKDALNISFSDDEFINIIDENQSYTTILLHLLISSPSFTPHLMYKYKHDIMAGNFHYTLCQNPNISIDIIKDLIGDEHPITIMWQHTSFQYTPPSILPHTINCIHGPIHQISNYHVGMLSQNPYLTPTMIRENIDLLPKEHLVRNRAYTMPLIREFGHFGYVTALSANPNLTQEYIDEGGLYIPNFSHEVALSPNYIRANIRNFNWTTLTKNRSLTLDLIREFEDRVDWNVIFENPNVTLAFIEEYLHKL